MKHSGHENSKSEWREGAGLGIMEQTFKGPKYMPMARRCFLQNCLPKMLVLQESGDGRKDEITKICSRNSPFPDNNNITFD